MHLFFGHYAIALMVSFFVYLGVEEPFAQLGEILSSCEVGCPSRLKQLTRNLYAGVLSHLPTKAKPSSEKTPDVREPDIAVGEMRQEIRTEHRDVEKDADQPNNTPEACV